MGYSAIAYIGYGIEYGESAKLPWGKYWNLDDWWLKESGYKPTNNPFDEDGEWRKDLANDERELLAHAMHDEEQAWKAAHLCPIELFICGSADAYSTVVCVPGSVTKQCWENSQPIDIRNLTVHPDLLVAFNEFCEKYELQGPCLWRLGASLE